MSFLHHTLLCLPFILRSFPAVKIDKPVNGIQYILKILLGRQVDVGPQNLFFPVPERAVKYII